MRNRLRDVEPRRRDPWETHEQRRVQQRQVQMAELMLEYGAKPDLQNQNGARPLVVALHGRDAGMVELLLEYGAEPTTANAQMLDPSGLLDKYGIGGMIGVVETHGQKLGRPCDGRLEPDLGQRESRTAVERVAA